MSLKTQTFSGLIWTFFDAVIARGVGLVASVLLARILSPREFGLLGMIYIFTATSASIADSGLSTSLIRTKNVSSIDYSTVFYVNIGISLSLYVIIFLLSPFIANFYNEPELVNIIRVYALIFVITSFSSVQQSILVKKMAFKRLMLLNMPGIIIGAGIGITMAYQDYGIWSIIFMQLITQSILSIMLWIASDWKPILEFSKELLKKHYNFGYKLMISGVLHSAFENVYNVLIGKYFTTQVLGQFERARTYNNYPVHILGAIISKVTYPLLTRLEDQQKNTLSAYKQILQLSSFISIPTMLILSAVSIPLFNLILGPQWNEAALFFKILCFAGMLYPVRAFNLNILKVFGRSDLFLKLEIFKNIIIITILFCAVNYGIYSIVWSIVLISILELIMNVHYTNKVMSYSLYSQIKDISISLLTMMYIVIIMINPFLYNYNLLLKVIILSGLGIVFYLLLNLLIVNPAIKILFNIKKV